MPQSHGAIGHAVCGFGQLCKGCQGRLGSDSCEACQESNMELNHASYDTTIPFFSLGNTLGLVVPRSFCFQWKQQFEKAQTHTQLQSGLPCAIASAVVRQKYKDYLTCCRKRPNFPQQTVVGRLFESRRNALPEGLGGFGCCHRLPQLVCLWSSTLFILSPPIPDLSLCRRISMTGLCCERQQCYRYIESSFLKNNAT